MTDQIKKKTVYDDLYNLPENMIGEIIDGELVASPRPSIEHIHAGATLGNELGHPYSLGRGGPGGWVIYPEPEIAFGSDILVPDLAGWRKERFLRPKGQNWITVIPDWICEIVSPSSVRIDRIKKLGIYAQHKVSYFWLIDPLAKTVDVMGLSDGKWLLLAVYGENDKVRAEPFTEIEIDLAGLWFKEENQ